MRRCVSVLLVSLISLLQLANPTRQLTVDDNDDDSSGFVDSSGNGSNGDNELEGSAVHPTVGAILTCQRQREETSRKNLVGAFRPLCTTDGEFEPLQCHTSARRCWCVNKDGQEFPGTRRDHQNKPKCSHNGEISPPKIVAPTRQPPPRWQPDLETQTTIKFGMIQTDQDDIFVDETSTSKSREKEARKTTQKIVAEGHDDIERERTPTSSLFIFKDPLILAGIICGAVLAIICIVLLIMFTIYRMRKKDEGSYALEEPKKSYAFAYTRARDQEFFA